MNFKELTDLIHIREYVINTINNPTLSRSTVKELNGILILLDNKIVSIITGAEFKEYIGYADVQKAIYEAAKITNIKSSFNK